MSIAWLHLLDLLIASTVVEGVYRVVVLAGSLAAPTGLTYN